MKEKENYSDRDIKLKASEKSIEMFKQTMKEYFELLNERNQ